MLDALFEANLNKVFSALALQALAIYALPTLWIHQDTTTITLYGAYAGLSESTAPEVDTEANQEATPVAPRPASGYNKDGHPDTPFAIEECLALGLQGVRGIVADSKA